MLSARRSSPLQGAAALVRSDQKPFLKPETRANMAALQRHPGGVPSALSVCRSVSNCVCGCFPSFTRLLQDNSEDVLSKGHSKFQHPPPKLPSASPVSTSVLRRADAARSISEHPYILKPLGAELVFEVYSTGCLF